MNKSRWQFSLAGLCGFVAVLALGMSQNTLSQAAFVVTCTILLAATIRWVFRPQPFWRGFVISGVSYLLISRLFATPPTWGQPDVMGVVHPLLALTLAGCVGTLASFGNRPRCGTHR